MRLAQALTYRPRPFSPLCSADGLALNERHVSPVAALLAVEGQSGERSAQGDARSFQIVSVDELGDVRTWTVVFLARPSASGSLDDLGTTAGAMRGNC